MSKSLKSDAVHGVFWSFVERFSLQGVQFLLGIVMARLLTPADYGVIAMLAIFMSLSQVFIDGGFTTALVQKQERTESDFSTVFYINLIVSLVCYGLLFLGAPYIAAFYEQPLLTAVTRVYALNLVINSLVAVNKTKLIIDLDFKTQSKISLIAAVVSGLVGLCCAYMGLSVWSLVVQMLLNSMLNVALSFYFVRWMPKAGFSMASFHRLFSYGSKLLAASIISSLYTNLYSLVIGKKFTSDKLGYYSRADQFAQLTSGNIAAILSRVSFPLLSKIQDNDERLVSVYSKYIQISAFIVFPIILGLGGVAKPLILILLTEKWVFSAYLLQILVFAYLWDCIILVNLNLLKVKGRTDLLLKLEIYKKAIALSILFITLFFNLTVICFGLVAYSCIAFYMNTIYTRKLLNYGFLQQVKEIAPFLLLSLLTAFEAFLLSEFFASPWVSLSLSLVVCPVTYFVLCYLFRLMPMLYFIEVVKEKVLHRK